MWAQTKAATSKTSDSDVVIAIQKLEHAIKMQLEATNSKPAGRLPIA
jgi:hypothetical protein